MISRREARQQAFEILFEQSFGGGDVESIIAAAGDARDIKVAKYAKKTASGVLAHAEEIDGYITQYSRARSFRRLSKVVLAALRLAIYEILYVDDLDAKISINEAVELAKTFSGQDEAGFVNGVLGGFMKAYNAGEIKAGEFGKDEPTAAEDAEVSENEQQAEPSTAAPSAGETAQ